MSRLNEQAAQETALEHFLLNHKIVYKKLNKARTATKKSIEHVYERATDNDNNDYSDDHAEFQKYDHYWGYIIENYKRAALLYDDLKHLEEILERLPQLIDKHYRALIELDTELLSMINEIKKPKYSEALALVRKIQKEADPLSGLTPEEFEPATRERSFMIRPPMRT